MFRRIDDFAGAWKHEADSTRKVMQSLTDASLAQPIVPGGRTLGFLAWHVTGALAMQASLFGLEVEQPSEAVPGRASEIAAAYDRIARALGEQVTTRWNDQRLTEDVNFYGRAIPAGLALEIVIKHQAHHRGQMTVLMRQAGVPVPGVYGPSKEEWAALGVPARE